MTINVLHLGERVNNDTSICIDKRDSGLLSPRKNDIKRGRTI